MAANRFFHELQSFALSLETDCCEIRAALDRPPLTTRDGLAVPFVEQMAAKVDQLSHDTAALAPCCSESISFVSLLKVCTSLYEANQELLIDMEDHLEQYGYTKVPLPTTLEKENCVPTPIPHSSSLAESDESSPMETHLTAQHPPDSPKTPTLESVGFSASGLAALRGEEGMPACIETESEEVDVSRSPLVVQEPVTIARPYLQPVAEEEMKGLPDYLTSQVSLSMVNESIERIVTHIQRQEGEGSMIQTELFDIMGMGTKTKAVLLTLLRLRRLISERREGGTVYIPQATL